MDFNTLHEDFENFFDLLAAPPRPLRPYDNVYFMAYDAEWYQSGEQNCVLSYQIATVSRSCSQNIIEFVPPGKRLKLAEIVNFGVGSVNGGSIPADHATARNLVVLISHSSVAEWSVLADRDQPYITSRLTAIRKSPVTSIKPIEVVLGRYECLCDVQMYDTRLIAPMDFQSLKKLSTLLGSEDEMKIELGLHHIKRMNRLIQIDYPLYEKYALQDSVITLKLFFLLQQKLMELAGHEKLYRTLASSAVKGFEKRAANFEEYQNTLKKSNFDEPPKHFFELARILNHNAYMGGRNEGFFVGRSDDYDATRNRLWVDVDFIGAYPTCMALTPTIDCGVDPFAPRKRRARNRILPKPVPGAIRYLPLRYQLPELTAIEFKKFGLNREKYDKACAVLSKITPDIEPKYHTQLMWEFNKLLGSMKSVDRKRLLEQALVVDNTLLNEWYSRWNISDEAAKRYIVPGFARIMFDFTEVDGTPKTLYPCLPVAHPSYGLIYPLKGETYATHPEIMLALDAGCTVKALESVELPVVKDEGNPVPRRLFFEHLADLTRQRNQQKAILKDKAGTADEKQKAIVLERLLKEFMNSFYGKTAQSVNHKKTYDPETGLMMALGPSPITDACTAALTTGLPRSALSSLLLAVDTYNRNKPLSEQIMIASCTTDGTLLGLPIPEGVSVTARDYYEVKTKTLTQPVVAGVGGGVTDVEYLELKKNIPSFYEILEFCGCGGVVPLIEAYMPIRMVKNARRELTTNTNGSFDESFLEIKHFADHIAAIKTRGQIGWLHGGIVTIQAKFGVKVPVTDILEEQFDSGIYNDLDERESIRKLEAEYDRIMNVGGTVKASLECGWILQQMERINAGETDVIEYTFYGLNSFNEILKGGAADHTQTKALRKFNPDFDWKRKLVEIDGVISPFSVPHLDLQEMTSYRGHVEKIHRRNEYAGPKKVIHSRLIARSSNRGRGGEAAKLVRLFLTGMLFDYISGGVKIGREGRSVKKYEEIAGRVNNVWNRLGFKFEVLPPRKKKDGGLTEPRIKERWTDTDLKNCARKDNWERNVVIPTARLVELLTSLCQEFEIDYGHCSNLLFATEHTEKVDVGIRVHVALAILKGPDLGIEPFKRLFEAGQLPTSAEILREFHPHLPESLLVSYEHHPFPQGACDARDKSTLVRLFKQLRLSSADAEECAQVLLPFKSVRTTTPRNPSKEKCVRVFAHALRNVVQPPVDPGIIMQKLQRYGLGFDQFYKSSDTKFDRHSIKNTSENRKLIRKMAALFVVDAEMLIREMIAQ